MTDTVLVSLASIRMRIAHRHENRLRSGCFLLLPKSLLLDLRRLLSLESECDVIEEYHCNVFFTKRAFLYVKVPPSKAMRMSPRSYLAGNQVRD